MATATTKTCATCRTDVSTRKRVKDAQGRYYCHPCWAGRTRPTPPPAESADYTCSTCRQPFAAEQGYDDHGAFVCHACFAQRPATPPLSPAAPAATSPQYGDGTRERPSTVTTVPADGPEPSDIDALFAAAAATSEGYEVADRPNRSSRTGLSADGAVLLTCTECGGMFTYANLRRIKGVAVCVRCDDARRSVRPEAGSTARGQASTSGVLTASTGSGQNTVVRGIFAIALLLSFVVLAVSWTSGIGSAGKEGEAEGARAARDSSDTKWMRDDLEKQKADTAQYDAMAKASHVRMGYEETGIGVRVRVEGTAKGAVSFRGWRLDGIRLYAVMTWNGTQRIAAIAYTVKRGGVVTDQGDLSVPGGVFRKDEPVEVHLPLADDEAARSEVVLNVLG